MPNRRLAVLGWTVALVAVAIFLYATAVGNADLRLLTKPWPVLILAAAVQLRSDGGIYARRVRNGLLASVVGDVCLEFDAGFLPGMGAFFVAHVFYIAAFLHAERAPRWARALPFALWGLVVLVALAPGLRAAGLLVPVAVYTVAICTMMWRSVARLGPGAGRDVHLAAAGALSFAVSDTLIAVTRFGPSVPAAPFLIILLYWAGQWGIAASSPAPAPPASERL